MSGIQMEKGDDEPSILFTERLGHRMENPTFRNALQQKLDLFLTYYLPGSGRTAATDSVLTEELRQILVGIAPNDEVEAFEVVGQSTWRGVRYKRDDGPLLLSVADAYGVHHRWNAMPAPLDEQVLMFTKPAAHCRVCDWLRAERWPTLGGCDVASVDG